MRKKKRSSGVLADFVDKALRLSEQQNGQQSYDPNDPLARVRRTMNGPMNSEDANREIFSVSAGGFQRGYPI